MCQHLPPIDQLPYLQDLHLGGMPGLQYISDGEITEEISASKPFFPSLKSLTLRRCHNLKGWWRRDTVGVATSSHQYQQQHVLLPSFPHLLKLEIESCNNLTCMPLFPSLEESLHLEYASCEPLQQTLAMTVTSSVPSSSNSSPPLSKLKLLTLVGIEDIEFLPENWVQNLASLEKLEIRRCDGLKSLSQPLSIQHLTSLKSLTIRYCMEFELFNDVDTQSVGVSPLQRLTISGVPRLVTLPLWIGNLTSYLEIFDCQNLISLSEENGNFTALEHLIFRHCFNFESLSRIGNLTSLQILEIFNCPSVISLPEGIGNLTALRRLEIFHCHNLESLPTGMHRLSSLQTLIIHDCHHLKERYQKGIGEIAHVPDFQYRDYY